jgi:predicted AAA+ superfamily ATPase
MKKGILENFVAQSLIANGYPIIFWESGSQAKVDFITWNSSGYIPMEVRTNSNTRSKNISVFKTKCRYMKDSIKISTKNFEYSNGVKYVPVYAVFCI